MQLCDYPTCVYSSPVDLPSPPNIDMKLPDSWMPLDVANTFELVKLTKTDTHYVEVADNFYKTLNKDNQIIDSIFRVQNHALWSAFCK